MFFTFIQLFVLFDKFKPKSSRVPSKRIPNNNTKGLYLINFDAQVRADWFIHLILISSNWPVHNLTPLRIIFSQLIIGCIVAQTYYIMYVFLNGVLLYFSKLSGIKDGYGINMKAQTSNEQLSVLDGHIATRKCTHTCNIRYTIVSIYYHWSHIYSHHT